MHEEDGALIDLGRRLGQAERELAAFRDRFPLRFQFAWRAVRFAVTADMNQRGGADIRMQVDLGLVPYSGEGLALRRRLLALAAWRESEGGARFALAGRHHLSLVAEAEAPATSAGAILAASARLALSIKPYLELAEEARHGAWPGEEITASWPAVAAPAPRVC